MSPSKIILSNDHLVAIDFLSTYGGQYFASRLSPPLNGVVQIQDLNLNRYSYCYRNLV